MNWLAHVLLSKPDIEFRLGNLLADLVKGRDRVAMSAGFLDGARHHQTIDAFTDAHSIVHRSRGRVRGDYRHATGILIDVFYDHFLALDFVHYASEPLRRPPSLMPSGNRILGCCNGSREKTKGQVDFSGGQPHQNAESMTALRARLDRKKMRCEMEHAGKIPLHLRPADGETPIDWYYFLNGAECGPVTATQLDQLVVSGVLRPTDLTWRKVAARGREAKFIIANLLEAPPEVEGQRLVSVTVRGRLLGGGFSTGNWHDACAAHQEAVYWSLMALATQAVHDRPDASDNAFTLAACYFDLGVLYQSAGRFRRAEWAFDEAFAIQERLARSKPQNPGYQQSLAASFNQRGLLYHDLGTLDEAKASIEKAVAIRLQLLQTHPADPWTAILMGGALCNLGAVLCNQGRYPEALDQYEQAITLIEGQLAKLARVSLSVIWGWLFPRRRFLRRSLRSTALTYLANTQAGRARVLELLGG